VSLGARRPPPPRRWRSRPIAGFPAATCRFLRCMFRLRPCRSPPGCRAGPAVPTVDQAAEAFGTATAM